MVFVALLAGIIEAARLGLSTSTLQVAVHWAMVELNHSSREQGASHRTRQTHETLKSTQKKASNGVWEMVLRVLLISLMSFAARYWNGFRTRFGLGAIF